MKEGFEKKLQGFKHELQAKTEKARKEKEESERKKEEERLKREEERREAIFGALMLMCDSVAESGNESMSFNKNDVQKMSGYIAEEDDLIKFANKVGLSLEPMEGGYNLSWK